jgi:hypothetical protein
MQSISELLQKNFAKNEKDLLIKEAELEPDPETETE